MINVYFFTTGAGGLPEYLPENQISVELDKFTYIGTIKKERYETIPLWMQPHDPLHVGAHFVFIRTAWNDHYEGTVYKTIRPGLLYSDAPGPVSAEIHIENNVYFTTADFRKYVIPTRQNYLYDNYFSVKNHIYLTIPGGPVYFATLKMKKNNSFTSKRQVTRGMEYRKKAEYQDRQSKIQ